MAQDKICKYCNNPAAKDGTYVCVPCQALARLIAFNPAAARKILTGYSDPKEELYHLVEHASPLPWQVEEDVLGCKNIVDASGESIMCTDGLSCDTMDRANAALVCYMTRVLEKL